MKKLFPLIFLFTISGSPLYASGLKNLVLSTLAGGSGFAGGYKVGMVKAESDVKEAFGKNFNPGGKTLKEKVEWSIGHVVDGVKQDYENEISPMTGYRSPLPQNWKIRLRQFRQNAQRDKQAVAFVCGGRHPGYQGDLQDAVARHITAKAIAESKETVVSILKVLNPQVKKYPEGDLTQAVKLSLATHFVAWPEHEELQGELKATKKELAEVKQKYTQQYRVPFKPDETVIQVGQSDFKT